MEQITLHKIVDNKFLGTISHARINRLLHLAKEAEVEAESGRKAVAALEQKQRRETPTSLICVVDKSASMGSTYGRIVLPACQQLGEMIQPDQMSVITFGKLVHHFRLKTSHTSTSEAESCIDANIFFEKEKYASLEPRTNILLAIRKLATTIADSSRHYNHVVVFLSDGEDNQNEYKRIREAADQLGASLRINHRILFLIVGIGNQSDTSLALHTKLAFQSLDTRQADDAMNSVYYAHNVTDLPNVLAALQSDINQAIRSQTVQLRVVIDESIDEKLSASEKANVLNDVGFLEGITRANVVSKISFLSSQQQRKKNNAEQQEVKQQRNKASSAPAPFCFLFNATPAFLDLQAANRCLEFDIQSSDGSTASLRVAFSSDTIPHMHNLRECIDVFVHDIRMSAVAQQEDAVERAMKTLNQLIEITRKSQEENRSSEKMSRLKPYDRVRMMKSNKSVLMALQNGFRELKDQVLCAKSMKSEQSATWLRKAQEMKFGAKALKRSKSSSFQEIVDNLIHLQKQLQERKYNPDNNVYDEAPISFVSVMNAEEHLSQLTELDLLKLDDSELEDTIDLLYAFGMIGRGIRVHRSDASTINPWSIGVEYISCDYLDTSTSLCCIDKGNALEDTTRRPIEDVLILEDPRNPEPYRIFCRTLLFESYLSLVFTRNLEMYQPTQRIALIANSMVHAISQLSSKEGRTMARIRMIFQMMYNLRRYMLSAQTSDINSGSNSSKKLWTELVNRLYGENPGFGITTNEQNMVRSTAQILVALCCLDEATTLFTGKRASKRDHSRHKVDKDGKEQKRDYNKQLCEVANAIVAECCARTARNTLRCEGVYSEDDLIQFLQKSLGIDDDSCPQVLPLHEPEPAKVEASCEINPDVAKQFAARLMKKPGCNVAEIEAAIMFADVIHNGVLEKCNKIAETNGKEGFEAFEAVLSDKDQHPEEICAEIVQRFFAKHFPESKDEGGDLVGSSTKNTGRKFLGNFFDRYVKSGSKNEFILSLTFQSVRHCAGSERQTVPFSKLLIENQSRKKDAPSILDVIAVECRLAVYARRKAEKRQQLERVRRAEMLDVKIKRNAEERKMFMETHIGQPTLFTAEEVAEMNQNRSDDDQLDLRPSGLLRNHCCYPRCEFYLKRLRFKKSISDEQKRKIMQSKSFVDSPDAKTLNASINIVEDFVAHYQRGVFLHLASWFYPTRSPDYRNGYHQRARAWLESHRQSTAAYFQEQMIDLLGAPSYQSEYQELYTMLKRVI